MLVQTFAQREHAGVDSCLRFHSRDLRKDKQYIYILVSFSISKKLSQPRQFISNYQIQPKENYRTPMPTTLKLTTLIQTLTIITTCIYDVPSYYGHFSKIYFSVPKIKQATFRYFQYHFGIDMDSNNQTVYFVNSAQHCIQRFDLATNAKSVLAGQCGRFGDRVGGVEAMLLNYPSSVVYYQPNQQSEISEQYMDMLIVANKDCLLTDPGCIINPENSNTNLNMTNLRPNQSIIQFPVINKTQTQYLFVSDTNNHCIKKIDMKIKTSIVIAGQCGKSGFTDGPTGFNKLNKPTNLGISRSGVLYFYDQGNQYMRKVWPNGEVETLLNGACKFYGKSRQIKGYWLNNILCYDNWVEKNTRAPIQHIIDPAQINICIEHSSKC